MTSMQANVALPMAGAAATTQTSDGAVAAAATSVSHQTVQADRPSFSDFLAANELNPEVLDSLVTLPQEFSAEELSVLDVLPSFTSSWTQNFEHNLNALLPEAGAYLQVRGAADPVQPQRLHASALNVPAAMVSQGNLAAAAALSKDVVEVMPHAVTAVIRSDASALLERPMPTFQVGEEAPLSSTTSIPVLASSTLVQQAAKTAAVTSLNGEQPLVHALSQRIQLQHAQGLDVATVRLDPPQWGTLEVRIQQGPVGVQVVMHASNAEVGRQLSGLADGLRQELQARTGTETSVVVAQSRQGASTGHGHPSREAPMPWAWADEEDIGQALQV